MPRLRQILKEKYTVPDEDPLLLDHTVQEEIIANLKSQLIQNKPHPYILYGHHISVLLLGLAFVTVPMYRKGVNTILSALACLILWLPCGLIYELCGMSFRFDQLPEYVRELLNWQPLHIWYAMIGYITVSLFKIYISSFERSSWIYLLPGLIGFCIVDQYYQQKNINLDVTQLEKFKYYYREA
ncbi:hypothetical protein DAMA08_019510 [Martiniozyma asiatica (nom. inval.)]|nr:hypothetical protein DAMA08_019510 [Martiniozyma asiatica]